MQQMCWLSQFDITEEKILYLRIAPNQPWRRYTAFPQYAVPDYDIPGGSKGWATFHKLKGSGWVLVPTPTGMPRIADDYDELAS